MQTFDWFSVGQKINFGFSPDIEGESHVGLIKKIKGSLVAIIISNRDKEKVKPNIGDTLHFFPEKDGSPWNAVGEVTQSASHPLLVLKFTEEPVEVGAEGAAEEPLIEMEEISFEPEAPEVEPPAEGKVPATEDFGIEMIEEEEEEEEVTQEAVSADLEMPFLEEEESVTDAIGLDLDAEEEEPLGLGGLEDEEESIADAIGVELGDDDDEDDEELPELGGPDEKEDSVSSVIGLELGDDDDDDDELSEPGGLEEDEESAADAIGLDLDAYEEDELPEIDTLAEEDDALSDEEESLRSYYEVGDDELDDDGPMLITSDVEEENSPLAVDIDSHFEDTQEIGTQEISDEVETSVDDSMATMTVGDEEEEEEEITEVALGDMSQSLAESDSDDEELYQEGYSGTGEGEVDAVEPEPFFDFFPATIHIIEPQDLNRIATAISSGEYDSEDQAFLEGIDLKTIDPDLKPIFLALLRKIGRVEKTLGGVALSGPKENSICLLLKPKRAYIFSPKPYDAEADVVLCVDHFWAPKLSFKAAGRVSSCDSELGGYVITVSFTHLSPNAEENIEAYLSQGAEFSDSLSDIVRNKMT